MSAKKPPLFGPPMKVKTVRAVRGRPELTTGEREERDRPILERMERELEELLRAGHSYADARQLAIERTAEAFNYQDDSTVAKKWRRWEPLYRALDKMDRMDRENERIIEALSTLHAENQGKKIGE